jgi:hypothetical protein
MHIISTRFSNVRVVQSDQHIFGLVTFETDQGLIHVECAIAPQDHRDIMDPHPRLLAAAKAKVRRNGHIPNEVKSVTVHDMLMSRVA